MPGYELAYNTRLQQTGPPPMPGFEFAALILCDCRSQRASQNIPLLVVFVLNCNDCICICICFCFLNIAMTKLYGVEEELSSRSAHTSNS